MGIAVRGTPALDSQFRSVLKSSPRRRNRLERKVEEYRAYIIDKTATLPVGSTSFAKMPDAAVAPLGTAQ